MLLHGAIEFEILFIHRSHTMGQPESRKHIGNRWKLTKFYVTMGRSFSEMFLPATRTHSDSVKKSYLTERQPNAQADFKTQTDERKNAEYWFPTPQLSVPHLFGGCVLVFHFHSLSHAASTPQEMKKYRTQHSESRREMKDIFEGPFRCTLSAARHESFRTSICCFRSTLVFFRYKRN